MQLQSGTQAKVLLTEHHRADIPRKWFIQNEILHIFFEWKKTQKPCQPTKIQVSKVLNRLQIEFDILFFPN